MEEIAETIHFGNEGSEKIDLDRDTIEPHLEIEGGEGLGVGSEKEIDENHNEENILNDQIKFLKPLKISNQSSKIRNIKKITIKAYK